MGFGKHLIAAVTPLHQVFALLFPTNEPIDLFSARRIAFLWNSSSASLSQKREWRDEICDPCLQWYFMCRRLICCDSPGNPAEPWTKKGTCWTSLERNTLISQLLQGPQPELQLRRACSLNRIISERSVYSPLLSFCVLFMPRCVQ